MILVQHFIVDQKEHQEQSSLPLIAFVILCDVFSDLYSNREYI